MTGGAGFIGSRYVRTLLGGGFAGVVPGRVTVLDELTYAGNLASLEPVAADPRYTFVRGDIADAALLAELVPGHGAVINFAAETHVDRSVAVTRWTTLCCAEWDTAPGHPSRPGSPPPSGGTGTIAPGGSR